MCKETNIHVGSTKKQIKYNNLCVKKEIIRLKMWLKCIIACTVLT